jgi:PTS system fructose-specific IIC component
MLSGPRVEALAGVLFTDDRRGGARRPAPHQRPRLVYGEAMNLLDLLTEETISLDMSATDKLSVIQQLVALLDRAGLVHDAEQVVQDILERERLMSTGVGSGVAIPHAQSKGAQQLAMAFGRTAGDIDFKSLDSKPVGLFFLIVAPEGLGGFVRILARISRLLYSGELQTSLREAKTPGEVIAIIANEEQRLRA